jgi:hypothetical protein
LEERIVKYLSVTFQAATFGKIAVAFARLVPRTFVIRQT